MELKYLAAYLPYKVSIKELIDNKVLIMTGGYFDAVFRKNMIVTSFEDNNLRFFLNEVKLILRPLSDLTKEIDVNGEKFVPVDIIFPKSEFKSEFDRNICIRSLIREIEILNCSCTYYSIVEKLLSWHFDIFGLIEKGEAIDINTLNKTAND